MRTLIPKSVYLVEMDSLDNKEGELGMQSSLTHLTRVNLIEDHYRYGDSKYLQSEFKGADTDGIIFTPSLFGFELFLIDQGYSIIFLNDFLLEKVQFELKKDVIIPDGAKKVK